MTLLKDIGIEILGPLNYIVVRQDLNRFAIDTIPLELCLLLIGKRVPSPHN